MRNLFRAQLRSERHQTVPGRSQGVAILRCLKDSDECIPAAGDLLRAQPRGERHQTVSRHLQCVPIRRFLQDVDECLPTLRDLLLAQIFDSGRDEIDEFSKLRAGFSTVGIRLTQPRQRFGKCGRVC